MNAESTHLLRAVAQAIIDSGYAEYDAPQPRRYTPRDVVQARIAAIAHDERLYNKSRRVHSALVDDIMEQYGVSRENARKLMHMARRVRTQ